MFREIYIISKKREIYRISKKRKTKKRKGSSDSLFREKL